MKNLTTLILSGIAFFLIFGEKVNAQKFIYDDSWDKQGFVLQKNHPDFVEINYSISNFSMEELMVEGEEMKDIALPGSFLFNNEGAPDLPGNGKLIAIPQGSVPVLEIISLRKEVIKDLQIAPAPRIPRDDENVPLQYSRDMQIYSRDAFYPAEPVILSNSMQIRGMDAIMVGITPFQYNPVTKELIVYRDLKVRITFKGGNGHFGDDRLRSRWWDPILEDALLNRNSLPEIDYNRNITKNGPSEDAGAEYLIITPDGASFIQWADSIKKFRTEQGISTLVRTLTQVGGNTTTAIEAYINNAYNTWTTPPAAVLLLGDYGTDAGSTVVSPIYDSYCVSDNIYGDVDGDHLPEITMARITANNATQLQVMVSKFLNYERNPPTSADFYDHPITALGWQTERWFQICSETVGGFWKNELGKNPVRINAIYGGNPTSDPWSTATNTTTVVNYFGPSGLGYIPSTPQSMGGWSGGNAAGINTAINNGAFMLQHRDHGMETGWGEPGYVSSDIDGLVNTDLTYIMSINCLTGKYNYSSECFAEKFHRYTYGGNNAGALGIMAASEVSYSFVNDTYVWGMYDNMWPQFMPAEGTSPESRGVMPAFGNAAGKIFLNQSGWPYNTDNKEVTYNLFHHHGDAFLTVYSEVPQNLNVTHNPVLFAGTTSFTVNADAGALIALTVNGEIIGTASATGAPVNITIPSQIPPSQMLVTVTKQNFYRYHSLVDVIPAEGPYVVNVAASISDPLPGGNNNGILDYEEAVQLSVSLKNVGIETALNVVANITASDPFIAINDNNAIYGNILPNETITIPDGFAITAANNIPDQHVVTFTLTATDGTDNWSSYFNITSNAPVLTIGTMTVQDNGPGCNNDGILDPGETADLVIACSNTGHSQISGVLSTLVISGGSSPYLTLNSTDYNLGTLGTGATVNAVFNVSADAATPLGTPVDLEFDITGGSDGQYATEAVKQIIIGLIPVFNMTSGSVTTCTGFFYDSGGASGAYLDSENLTQTFYPATPGNMIRMVFNSFTTESGYDYLRIYNGTSTSDPLIGTYNGTTGPGTVTANNASGALTFNFTSDGSVTRDGWEAAISCYNSAVPPVAAFTVSNASPAILSTVTFTDQSENVPTSWAWSFSPATVTYMNGTNSASQNPQVQFTALGEYTVTLTATNAYGSDTEIKTNYINVLQVDYCIPTYTTGTSAGDYITLVQLGSINNATGASASPYYTYYSNLSTDLTPGSAYTITLSPGTYSSGNYVAVWIDFNRNSVFDTGEKLGTISISPTPATGTITFTVPADAAAGITRMRVREVWNNSNFDACTTYSYGETEDYNINIQSTDRTLNLTVLLESLYNGNGTMRKAQGAGGDQYSGNTADQVSVELHSASDYSVIVHTEQYVNLSTAGALSIALPGSHNGSYYITVKHRNSIETTTKQPVSFGGSLITYDFDGPEQAFGNNLLQMIDGHYVIYCGDVNLDGIIDTGDITPVDNDAGNFATGYLPTDVNGDGTVDTGDMTILDNNAANFTGTITP
ncbi:MAG: C25 family cysteine peptidase [Bacteroidota bacterium]